MTLKSTICSLLLVTLMLQAVYPQQGQSLWLESFERELSGEEGFHPDGKKKNTLNQILTISKSGNSFNFMYLGPLVDALNNMYLASDDEKYLKYNHQILENLITASTDSKIKKGAKSWYVSSNQEAYSGANGNEWMLFEGHLFRYIVQYLYIVQDRFSKLESEDIKSNFSKQVEFVVLNVWDKWITHSVATHGDLTNFYGVRLHIGSHWATIAIFLEDMVEDEAKQNELRRFYSSYNFHLRRNIGLTNDKLYWDSTWDTPFLAAHIDRRSRGYDKKRTQDVAHGNHVLQYIYSAVKLKKGWSKTDVNFFSQVFLKNVINQENLISRDVDGSGDYSYRNISDGWAKLAFYNDDVKSKLYEYYKKNQSNVEQSYQNLQFFAVMCLLESKSQHH
ncbi:hypothetical protein [Parapedobacter soli]|uniref:hypothetical protein n=1 Tax=Parapedobacter soli TaxID=416955 RepID=UPI0021C81156|nr:hypothetical protein [Parapedobacter soli]